MDGTVLYLTSWLSIMLTVYGMYVKSLAPAWYSETVDDFFRCLYRYETCYLSITSCMRICVPSHSVRWSCHVRAADPLTMIIGEIHGLNTIGCAVDRRLCVQSRFYMRPL